MGPSASLSAAADRRATASPRERALLAAAGIPGWLTRREAGLLFDRARSAPPGTTIVEIGSYHGRSTVCLALGARQGTGNRVVSVDPHLKGSLAALRENLHRTGVESQVEVRATASEAAGRTWRRPVGLLFVDGDHAHASVEADLEIWSPHVVQGGCILLHDTTGAPWSGLFGYPGPRALANRLLRSPRTRRGRVVDTITLVEKGSAAGWTHRLATYTVLLRKAPTDVVLLVNSVVPKRWKRRLAGRASSPERGS